MTLGELFESIDQAYIEGWIAAQKQETLHLEFKRAGASMQSADDKKNLAVAVSGFSNSDGGLIVWGVDARKVDGVDCAKNAQLITPLNLFLSRLSELTHEVSSPAVMGIQHKAIDCGDNNGFAVTFVPVSDSGPHMAKLGEDRYYKRAGSSFIKMEHFDIEDMFGRRRRPVLEVQTRLQRGSIHGGPEGNKYDLSIVLGVTNRGRGSALAPFLRVRSTLARFGISNTQNSSFLMATDADGFSTVISKTDIIIHPSVTIEVAAIPRQINERELDKVENIILAGELAAEDFPLRTFEVTVLKEDILSILPIPRRFNNA